MTATSIIAYFHVRKQEFFCIAISYVQVKSCKIAPIEEEANKEERYIGLHWNTDFSLYHYSKCYEGINSFKIHNNDVRVSVLLSALCKEEI